MISQHMAARRLGRSDRPRVRASSPEGLPVVASLAICSPEVGSADFARQWPPCPARFVELALAQATVPPVGDVAADQEPPFGGASSVRDGTARTQADPGLTVSQCAKAPIR